MLNVEQIRNFVIQPSLQAIGLASKEAVELLVGTALIESGLTQLAQRPTSIALGLWQMENPTYTSLLAFLDDSQHFKQSILDFLAMKDLPRSYGFLAGNLYASCIFARLKYYTIDEPLPQASDVRGLSNYWGKYYNTKNLDRDKKRFVELYNKYGKQ
jgi:hypothetical protein